LSADAKMEKRDTYGAVEGRERRAAQKPEQGGLTVNFGIDITFCEYHFLFIRKARGRRAEGERRKWE